MRARAFAFFLSWLPAAVLALGGPSPVHEFTLANGMKVVFKEDHRAPVVVSQVWYRVGASYEHGGITGLSHMLEHLMFKGTHRYGPGEFSRLVAAEGGSENAFTSQDYTAYFQRLARDRLETSFRLESDRMTGLLLDDGEFQKERQVVAEERRMRTEDKPQSLAYEQFQAAAFTTSPYHHPVIGWMSDIQNYTIDDLRDWYHRWYTPDNSILVVVGDEDPARVREMAERYFAPIPRADRVSDKPRPEIPQPGERRLVVKAPARLPYLVMGYKVPSLPTDPDSWEPYALDVLASVLDGDDSARLSRDLLRGKAIAAQAGADYDLYSRLSTLLTLEAVPNEGHDVVELEKALREQIRRLREESVTDAELSRIKTQVVADDVYQKDSVFYQAMRIGQLEAIGVDWRVDDQYVARIRAVTPEQVQDVARKYLVDDHLTVAVLEPQPLDGAPRRPAAQGARHDF